MAQTYAQLQKQIADLNAQAEKLKSSEVPGIIGKIRELVGAYNLSAADIFGKKGGGRRVASKGTARSRIKYQDSNGNVWVGMGKRPQWLRDALAEGRSLEEFATSGSAGTAKPRPAPEAAAAPAPRKAAAKQPRKGAGKVKYRDGDRSWSGYGPQPGWLKEAIAGGRSLEEFQA